jgi:histidine triad (HIT) family protein
MGPRTTDICVHHDGRGIYLDHESLLAPVVSGAVCVFCDIASNNAAAEVVFTDELSVAFLDIKPLFPGHCLLIPRAHVETLVDLPPGDVGPFFTNARSLARAVPRAMGAKGSFVAINNVVSQSVPHLHVHVVPRSPKDGLKGFFWPRRGYRGDEHAAQTAAAIRTALEEGEAE